MLILLPFLELQHFFFITRLIIPSLQPVVDTSGCGCLMMELHISLPKSNKPFDHETMELARKLQMSILVLFRT